MKERNITGYDGPRTPRADEWEAVLELGRSIFFPNKPTYEAGFVTWPMALHEDNRGNCYAMFLSGEPVSAIGRLERDIVVKGYSLRMGFIGGVCTHPDHRGKGLASTILQACFAKFRENNVDFVYISGTRPMYYGAGANHIGGTSEFTVRAGELSTLKGVDATLREATLDDVELLASLNEAEGVRFVRIRRDYELSITHGYCSGKACTFRVIETNSIPVGYLIVTRPSDSEPRTIHILEYVGDRFAVLSVLAKLAEEVEGGVVVNVPEEEALGRLLWAAGIEAKPARTSGTVKVLDFDRTMRKLLPYFASHLPDDFMSSLSFSASEGKYVAWSGKEALEIEGEVNMLWTLLGCPAGESISKVRATPIMQLLLDRCLPLPLPSMHLNMI